MRSAPCAAHQASVSSPASLHEPPPPRPAQFGELAGPQVIPDDDDVPPGDAVPAITLMTGRVTRRSRRPRLSYQVHPGHGPSLRGMSGRRRPIAATCTSWWRHRTGTIGRPSTIMWLDKANTDRRVRAGVENASGFTGGSGGTANDCLPRECTWRGRPGRSREVSAGASGACLGARAVLRPRVPVSLARCAADQTVLPSYSVAQSRLGPGRFLFRRGAAAARTRARPAANLGRPWRARAYHVVFGTPAAAESAPSAIANPHSQAGGA